MKYKYENNFSKSFRNLPVAYYYHHSLKDRYPFLDAQKNCIFAHPHNHAEIEFLLFTKGSGFCKVGNPEETILFEEGDIIIVNPFEPHMGAYWKEGSEHEHLCLDFSVSLLEHPVATILQRLSNDLLAQNVRCETLVSHTDPIYPELKKAFQGLYNSTSGQKENDLKFFAELFRFFDLLYDNNKIHKVKLSPSKERNMDFIKSTLDYIGKHYSENISTKDICQTTGYCKEHFCRLFKVNFSIPFIEYLTQFRIEKSKILLLDHSSSEVSELCGFSSQSYFAKAFREITGISPTEYRHFISKE